MAIAQSNTPIFIVELDSAIKIRGYRQSWAATFGRFYSLRAKKKNGEFGWTYRKKVYYKCEYRPATILSPISISDISPTCGRAQGEMNSDSDFVQIYGSS